jgi:non-canonical (house-cleaning) NTP pyrophosphatase
MKKVIIASKNPVKIQSVKNGFEKMFLDQDFEFIGISTPSGVADQPFSNSETFLGAQNEMEAFAWVFIISKDKRGKARTGTFFLPNEVVNLVKEGKELGDADDIVFNRRNSKQESGAVGILTGDVIDRTKYYTEAVILALIPFKNVDLY